MLWMYQRTFLGKDRMNMHIRLTDLSVRDWVPVVPLILMMVWLGCYTQSFMPAISSATRTPPRSDNHEQSVPGHARHHLQPAQLAEVTHAR